MGKWTGTLYLCYSSSKITADEVFVPLQLRLNNNEGEVGLRVHIARHLLDFLDLFFYAVVYALKEAISRPATGPMAMMIRYCEPSKTCAVQVEKGDLLEELRGRPLGYPGAC